MVIFDFIFLVFGIVVVLVFGLVFSVGYICIVLFVMV